MAPKKQDDLMALPLFDGERPDNVINRFTGRVTLDVPVGQALHRDSVGYAVVEYEVADVGHKSTTKDGVLSRIHALKVNRVGLLDPNVGGELILESHRLAREAAGIKEFPFDDSDPAAAPGID